MNNVTIKIEKSNESIIPEAIETFEMVIGKKLPDDYKKFLLTFNGGEPESNRFAIPNTKNGSGVRNFYTLKGKREEGDLYYEREILFDRVPNDILPIGSDSFGNCICLSLRADTSGRIFFWDHELEAEEGEPATFANLFNVGNSFLEFFGSLQKFDKSQVTLKPGQVKKVWIDPDFLKEQREKGNTTE